MNKNVVAVIIVVLLIAAGGWYYLHGGKLGSPAGATAGSGDTVATVNGDKILRSDLTAAETTLSAQQGTTATSTEAQAQLQSQALDTLIAQALLRQAAQSAGITASSTAVDAQLAAAKQQFGSTTAYE